MTLPCETKTDGWPTDTGPLHTLHQLGLTPWAGYRPIWLHYPKVRTSNGRTFYTGSSRFLFNEGIRALAALSLENYTVKIFPAGPDQLEFRIEATA
jgi:hypothetical protein